MLSKTPVKEPTVVQRNPLVIIGIIVAIAQYLLAEWEGLSALLLSLGVAPAWVDTAETILIVILTLGGIFVGKAFVTPLSSPRNQAGEALTAK